MKHAVRTPQNTLWISSRPAASTSKTRYGYPSVTLLKLQKTTRETPKPVPNTIMKEKKPQKCNPMSKNFTLFDPTWWAYRYPPDPLRIPPEGAKLRIVPDTSHSETVPPSLRMISNVFNKIHRVWFLATFFPWSSVATNKSFVAACSRQGRKYQGQK